MNIIDLNINSFLIKHSNKQWLKIQQKQERERERERLLEWWQRLQNGKVFGELVERLIKK